VARGARTVPAVIPCTYCVSVTPDGGYDPSRSPNTSGYTTTFTATNTGTATATFAFDCYGTVGVACQGVNPASRKLSPGAKASVTATYDVGASGGTLVVSAVYSTASHTGYKLVETPPGLGPRRAAGHGQHAAVTHCRLSRAGAARPGHAALTGQCLRVGDRSPRQLDPHATQSLGLRGAHVGCHGDHRPLGLQPSRAGGLERGQGWRGSGMAAMSPARAAGGSAELPVGLPLRPDRRTNRPTNRRTEVTRGRMNRASRSMRAADSHRPRALSAARGLTAGDVAAM
jgi:hypothetical protein